MACIVWFDASGSIIVFKNIQCVLCDLRLGVNVEFHDIVFEVRFTVRGYEDDQAFRPARPLKARPSALDENQDVLAVENIACFTNDRFGGLHEVLPCESGIGSEVSARLHRPVLCISVWSPYTTPTRSQIDVSRTHQTIVLQMDLREFRGEEVLVNVYMKFGWESQELGWLFSCSTTAFGCV